MDKMYVKLFTELAHAVELLAEQVKEYNHQHDDSKGEETAETMRSEYAELYDKLRDKNFDGNLEKADYAKLLIGAYVIVNHTRTQIEALNKSIQGYEQELIPKLHQLVDSEEVDVQKLADSLLILEDNQ